MKPWHMGTHLRVLGESYPMNTIMTGFRWFLCILVLRTKVALALEGLLVFKKGVNPFTPATHHKDSHYSGNIFQIEALLHLESL